MACRRATQWEILRLKKSWYKKRYKWHHRLRAAIHLVGSCFERWGWGYGESPGLLLVWAVVSILLFGSFYHMQGFADLQINNGESLKHVGSAFEYSALAFVGSGERPSWPDGPTAAIAIQRTLGILFIGVFAAAVYRWISIRQG